MAAFVLIHGAFHTGACFDPVVPLLAARGHTVRAPTLPGMGGSDEALRAVTLDGWADFVLAECRAAREEAGAPVILAGHSRGGLVISAAAEKDPDAAEHLAYICALLVPAGAAREQLAALMPAHPDMQTSSTLVAGGAGITIDPDVAARYFAHRCPDRWRDHARAGIVTEPTAPLATPLEVTEARWGRVPRTYIECLHDRTMPIDRQRAMIALAPGTQVGTLDADHSPFYDTPELLAGALVALTI